GPAMPEMLPRESTNHQGYGNPPAPPSLIWPLASPGAAVPICRHGSVAMSQTRLSVEARPTRTLYAAYFGLAEAPFSIAPDPRYLFLSDCHREALAHLLYGSGEGGGFIQLTGEVGTGKTTLCRALLEQLPADLDVALIL